MTGLQAAEKLLNKEFSIEAAATWYNWPERAALGFIAEALMGWLIVDLQEARATCKNMWEAQARLSGNLPSWFNEAMEQGRQFITKKEKIT